MYKNTEYSDKYYYAYITEIKYINDNMTEMKIQTDVFQTWQFDFIYKKSFIERKHVTDDIIGRYTLLEPVTTGEYVVNEYDYYSEFDEDLYVIQATELISPYDTLYNDYYVTDFAGIPMAGWTYMLDSVAEVKELISGYNTAGKISAIYNAYMIPKICVQQDQILPIYPHIYYGQVAPMVYSKSYEKPIQLDNYSPKNNKLLTFPYCYMLMSNNNGSSNILHYEKFKDNMCEFIISGIPTPNGSIKCTPTNYASNHSFVEEEGILAGKYPTLNWNFDVYADWLLTNSASLNTQKNYGAISAGIGVAGAIGTGAAIGATLATGGALAPLLFAELGFMGATFAGAEKITNAMALDYEHSLMPNSTQGLAAGGDINVAQDCAGFFFYKYSIKKENAKIIDDYFSMFGYKVNSLEIPQLYTRKNWNYLKVVEPNIEGDEIPDTDMNKYKQMLEAGITFWHNPNTFRDYSQSNDNK